MTDNAASYAMLLPAAGAVIWSDGGWRAAAMLTTAPRGADTAPAANTVVADVAPMPRVDDARDVARRLAWRVGAVPTLVVLDESPYGHVHADVAVLAAPAAILIRDNSGDLALQCPHPTCGRVGDIREVNVSDVWSPVNVFSDRGEARLRIDAPCGADGFEGDGWLCAGCAQPVDLPDDLDPTDAVYR